MQVLRRVGLGCVAVLLACCSNSGGSAKPDATLVTTTTAVATTTTQPAIPEGDWSWLDPLGVEPPAVVALPGFQVMDVGSVRFQVPNGWAVPWSQSCIPAGATGAVLLTFLRAQTVCDPASPVPDGHLAISMAEGDPPVAVPDAHVGSFLAWKTKDKKVTTYRLTNGISIEIGGADAPTILSTFTDSGARRVVRQGELHTTVGWKPVTFEGISIAVPAAWDVVDLAAQVVAPGTPAFPNPGTCSDPWFSADAPRVFLGNSTLVPECGPQPPRNLTPTNGVWMREVTEGEAAALGSIVAHGTTNGLDLSVIDELLPQNDTASPVADIVISTPLHTVLVSIGPGLDTTLARAILHSLHE